MTHDPFANANLVFLGGQIAQVWQRTLDAWWRALVGDPKRLGELARELSKLRSSSLKGGQTGSTEMATLIRALELLEQRIRMVEEHSGTPSSNAASLETGELAGLVGALESLESRLNRVEEQVAVLTETTTRILKHLEALDG